jgi:Electron transfer DM13
MAMATRKLGRIVGLALLLFSGLLLQGEAGMLPMTWEGALAGSNGHHAAGKAVLSDGPYGALLALKGIAIDQLPDGRVYLARNGDYRQGLEVGRLTRFSGDVSFKVPAGADPAGFDSVVIWCEKFQVEIGRAPLREQGL